LEDESKKDVVLASLWERAVSGQFKLRKKSRLMKKFGSLW